MSERPVTRLTSGPFNSYPLYYFTPSETADGRHLVIHSERGGYVNLHRLTLATGETVQLTDGRTNDSGWAIWCEWHLRGIRNHLSAINLARNEVYYFQDDEIRATHLETMADRRLAAMPPGRLSIGQTDVSPDGNLFAFIHTDAANYTALLKEREALIAMPQFHWDRDHQAFRNKINANKNAPSPVVAPAPGKTPKGAAGIDDTAVPPGMQSPNPLGPAGALPVGKLPAGGYATPSVYEVSGTQYVVIAAGGGKMETAEGDAYVAYRIKN